MCNVLFKLWFPPTKMMLQSCHHFLKLEKLWDKRFSLNTSRREWMDPHTEGRLRVESFFWQRGRRNPWQSGGTKVDIRRWIVNVALIYRSKICLRCLETNMASFLWFGRAWNYLTQEEKVKGCHVFRLRHANTEVSWYDLNLGKA